MDGRSWGYYKVGNHSGRKISLVFSREINTISGILKETLNINFFSPDFNIKKCIIPANNISSNSLISDFHEIDLRLFFRRPKSIVMRIRKKYVPRAKKLIRAINVKLSTTGGQQSSKYPP